MGSPVHRREPTLLLEAGDRGLAQDGLAYLDALKARCGGKEEWDFRIRLLVRARCGLLDEAIGQAQTHPEGDTWYAACSLSGLLATAGRTEETLGALERHPTCNTELRTRGLIDVGPIDKGAQVLQQRSRRASADDPCAHSDEPPF